VTYQPTPSPGQAPTPQPPVKQGNGFGVTALVLGIFAILGFWLPLVNISSIVLGALALVFAIVAFAVARKREGAGNATGATGLVLGILAIGFALGWKIVVFEPQTEEAQQECVDAGSSIEACAEQAEEVANLEGQVEQLKDELAELVESGENAEQPADSGGEESAQPEDSGEAPAEEGTPAEETTE
jgi:hypothetical protein